METLDGTCWTGRFRLAATRSLRRVWGPRPQPCSCGRVKLTEVLQAPRSRQLPRALTREGLLLSRRDLGRRATQHPSRPGRVRLKCSGCPRRCPDVQRTPLRIEADRGRAPWRLGAQLLGGGPKTGPEDLCADDHPRPVCGARARLAPKGQRTRCRGLHGVVFRSHVRPRPRLHAWDASRRAPSSPPRPRSAGSPPAEAPCPAALPRSSPLTRRCAAKHAPPTNALLVGCAPALQRLSVRPQRLSRS
jgi:hypothetical protein